ncbi:hypothetical protein J4216_02040 [Candidatus Woesearchaeota archaeon]|nr:hypothetical protein [Candidatus Woesearchaeota archaeon]
MEKQKATYEDLYHALSYREWKTVNSILDELDSKGLSTKHMRRTYAGVYQTLVEWVDEGLVRDRKGTIKRDLDGKTIEIPIYEYLRVSTGIPEKLKKEGALESKLATS